MILKFILRAKLLERERDRNLNRPEEFSKFLLSRCSQNVDILSTPTIIVLIHMATNTSTLVIIIKCHSNNTLLKRMLMNNNAIYGTFLRKFKIGNWRIQYSKLTKVDWNSNDKVVLLLLIAFFVCTQKNLILNFE
jgi:hypothetical protein